MSNLWVFIHHVIWIHFGSKFQRSNTFRGLLVYHPNITENQSNNATIDRGKMQSVYIKCSVCTRSAALIRCNANTLQLYWDINVQIMQRSVFCGLPWMTNMCELWVCKMMSQNIETHRREAPTALCCGSFTFALMLMMALHRFSRKNRCTNAFLWGWSRERFTVDS